MEQNQNCQQVVLKPEEQKIQIEQLGQQRSWEKIRNEFAPSQESIGQTEDAIALIEKWIWIQHQQQFKEYEVKLKERSDITRNMKEILGQIIDQQKQASWMINQKYGIQQANTIIVKLRQSIQNILNSQPLVNPEVQPESNKQSNQQKPIAQSKESSPIEQASSNSFSMNFSALLPQIAQKGRVYNVKQMASSFHLLKQTEQEYEIKSGQMFDREKIKKSSKSKKVSLFENKYLRQAFKWFCKQGYNSSGLFEDFSKQADKMNLNKWMVFCKQFDFIDKFSKKQLVELYQTATKFASYMLIQNFLKGVALLQQKYFQKFHKGEYDFVGDILKIDNEAAFRCKIDNLKIKYSGPRRNFFEYAHYLERQREDDIQKQKLFQAQKKERQVVLIKGMFEDHLKDEVNQLKLKRDSAKLNKLSNSFSVAQTNRKRQIVQQVEPIKSARFQDMNYSKIFEMNRASATKKQSNQNVTKTGLSSNMYKTESIKSQIRPKFEHKRFEAHTTKNSMKDSANSNIFKKMNENSRQEVKDTTWLTNIRSDTQQSDEILKQHLMIEKKMKNNSSRIQNLMQELKDQSKKVEKIKQQIHKQNQEDDENDMIETQINFKSK